MGVTTDGQICFGITLEEGVKLPWDTEKYDYDMDEWWMSVNNYQGAEYPEEGWIIEQTAWLKQHPLPVKLVNFCSEECYDYILAVPKTCKTANRGYPLKFIPSELTVTKHEISALTAFIDKYKISTEDEAPTWWLSSYWG